MNYELIPATDYTRQCVLLTREDGSVVFIPEDPQNIDYQAFLEWQAAGNVAPERTQEP